jgi:hypothetical protein
LNQTPTPGTKPLRGTHDLGEIVGYSYRLYFRDFLPLFGLALLTAPIEMLSGVIAQSSDSDGVAALVQLLQLPQILVTLIVVPALIFATHTITGGERPSFTASLDASFERFGAVFRTFLLLVGLIFAAVFAAPFLAIYWLFNREATIDGRRDWYLAIVPGLLLFYLAVRWAFYTQAVVILRKDNWAALDDSADAIRGQWWRTLGITIVVTLIMLGPYMLASLANALPPLAASAIISSVSALVLPFAIIAQTLLYYDLKTRKQAVAAATAGSPYSTDAATDSTEAEENRDDERFT